MTSSSKSKAIKWIQSPLYFFLISVALLFIAELIVMNALPFKTFGLLKALLVVVFASPGFLLFIYFPFKLYFAERQKTEDELCNINLKLQINLEQWSQELSELRELNKHIT